MGVFSNLQEFKTPDMSVFLQKRKLFDWVNFKMKQKKLSQLRHDIQHNDTQHNGTQRNTQHNGT